MTHTIKGLTFNIKRHTNEVKITPIDKKTQAWMFEVMGNDGLSMDAA